MKFTCRDDGCINYACREECGKSRCVEYCGNQRITRGQFRPVQVFDAGPKGYGLRVLTDCQRGDIIQEYTGQAVRAEALTKLFRRYQHERKLYIMALDDKVYLDAKKAGGLARYINHSCRPNCKIERWKVKGNYRAAVQALQDISAGTELTFDYQWTRKTGRAPTKCHCGEANCRGTIELSKSLKETQNELLANGRWAQPKQKRADERIVNRTIRIKQQAQNINYEGLVDSDDEQDEDENRYSIGDISDYHRERKLHKILFSYPQVVERWEDLNSGKLDWLILEEQMSPSKGNAIARKVPIKASSTTTGARKNLSDEFGKDSTSGLLAGFSSSDPVLNKQLFYLYIQTPIKEAVFGPDSDLKEKVQRNCQVTVTVNQQARPPLACNTSDPEDVAKYAALDQSTDGTVWKVSISGKDVASAHKFLSKSVAYWQKKQQEEGFVDPNKWADEVIFPRAMADLVRRRLPSLRERNRNVSIGVKPSDSKSKQIARIVLEGSNAADKQTTRALFRNAILDICKNELPALDLQIPLVTLNRLGFGTEKVPRDFGFLGGSLTKEQFESLLENGSKLFAGEDTRGNNSDRKSTSATRPRQKESSAAGLDLNQSPFFTTFEQLYGPVWVQSEDDMGRINSNHQLVGDASSTDERKVYFGCDPNDLAERWHVIERRAQDVLQGVRFLYLGTDHVYLQFMAQSNFFPYIERTTGCNVCVDTSTGNHLRIEGKSTKFGIENNLSPKVKAMPEVMRADLAEELVRLQTEVFRDQFTRKQNWIFGRDWSTVDLPIDEPLSDTVKQVATSFGQLDSRSAPHSCMEMSDVVAHLDLPCSVAAHAATILYRFVSIVPQTQIKARDALLACVYIANKAQKAKKWRKLTAVLEAGYKSWYPGTKFDPEREEVIKLEQRVLDAEQDMLKQLEFDVFVRDMDTLEQSVSRMQIQSIESLFSFAFGPQILGAGANLWLKYGMNYIFAASAAVLKANLEEIVSSLDLIPLKVAEAFKLIVEYAKYGKHTGDKAPAHKALESDKSVLEKYIPKIEESCMQLAQKGAAKIHNLNTSRQRCLAIGKANCRNYAIRRVSSTLVKNHVLKHLDGIEAESGCSIYLGPSATPLYEDITIEGPWRAVAIADQLLRSTTEALSTLPPAVDASVGTAVTSTLQVKTNAGLVEAREVCTSGGWDGTLHPASSKQTAEKQLGGKNCVAGRVSAIALRDSGLRWWIPRAKGSSPSGSFTDMFSIRRRDGDELEELANMANTLEGSSTFPLLCSLQDTSESEEKDEGRESPRIAVSLQRWPTEKVELKEEMRGRKSKRLAGGIGFSAGGLQEMQLLTILHSLVPSPHGHPNFVLPIAIAIPGQEDQETTAPPPMETGDDPMFSLFKSNRENEKAAMKEKKVKNSPHLIFQPCPFVLHKFLSKKKSDIGNLLDSPAVVSAWFHDLISGLVHCHSNNIILRSIQTDQILLDHSGVAKFSGLYRASVQGLEERRHARGLMSVVKELKRSGSKRKHEDDDEAAISPFAAPEIVLGSPKHTKQSDVWMMGCMLANIMLGKPVFSGKDRQSLLTSMYKVVGTPAKQNFADGARFPHYFKPHKKYPRGVGTAFKHMLKKGGYADEYKNAISLIEKMLHLDPEERCTAEEALNHDFLSEHRENIEDSMYRSKYVAEWTELKKKLVKTAKYATASSDVLSQQRKQALLLATTSITGADSNDDNGDDLYNFEL